MVTTALLRRGFRAFGNSGRLLREQSVFKVLVVLFFASLLFFGLGGIFYEGFEFLRKMGGAGLMVIHRLFGLFFFGLSIMLVFSSIVTSYATIFRSDEIPSLMVRPVPLGEMVLYKYCESALLSSWAFFFMILPFVGAYALQEKMALTFVVWTFLFSIPFVLLASGIGTILTLLLVRCLPTGRSLWYLVGGGAALLLAWGLRMYVDVPEVRNDSALLLARLVPGLQISSHPLWPSWWVAEGIMAMGRGQIQRGLLLWLTLSANVLLLGMVIEWLGRKVFYEGWLKVGEGRGSSQRRSLELRGLESAMAWTRTDSRGMLMKDVRTFLRDPLQWTQAAVFFGLLAIYFLNLRNLQYHLLSPMWKNLIVFLNLFSVAAVICSLSSRFIYPQMSFEGHGFWILGMSPVTMRRVLWSKFWLSCACVTMISTVLMVLSVSMLHVTGSLYGLAILLSASICVTVTGLSMGLGAVFMDLRERNPAAIVSSFGGTLNLVLSMAFTFAVMIPFGVLFHQIAMENITPTMARDALVLGIVVLVAATALCAWIPMRLGEASLERREF